MKNRTNFFILFSVISLQSLFITASSGEQLAIQSLAAQYLLPSPSQANLDLSDVSTPREHSTDEVQDCKARSVTPSPKKPGANKDDIDSCSMTPCFDHKAKSVTPSPKKERNFDSDSDASEQDLFASHDDLSRSPDFEIFAKK